MVDAIATFWSNTVLVYPAALEHISGALLLPTWPWIIISAWMLLGTSPQNWRRPLDGIASPTWRASIPYVVVFGAIVAVLVAGFILGAAKGSLRTLPTGIHQVSTLDLNKAEWTTVSTSTYHMWAARFVREDAFFATFGLAMIAFCSGLNHLRRRLLEQRVSSD